MYISSFATSFMISENLYEKKSSLELEKKTLSQIERTIIFKIMYRIKLKVSQYNCVKKTD